MNQNFLFTSESVAEGHPDKIADQISDAILDALLKQDPFSRVACETIIKTGLILLAGEITTKAWIDMEAIARQVVNDIGFNQSSLGFDAATCAVLTSIGKQSEDIALSIKQTLHDTQGAGDQGIIFGYACNDTEMLMPAPIFYAHKLVMRQAYVRKKKILPWLRPDAKSQITFYYENNRPLLIENIVFSTQHDPEVTSKDLIDGVMEEIIKPCFPVTWLKQTRYFINPAGRFVIGGPQSDCGLTGRKIIVDTYGGAAHHGGGSFSGKDPTKVDRTGAYMARYIAKNIVAAKLAARCEIQLCYAIGLNHPTAINIETFGTAQINNEKLFQLVKKHFDLSPAGMIKMLDLLKPIYQQTACYGHFGREDIYLPWEQTDKTEALRNS